MIYKCLIYFLFHYNSLSSVGLSSLKEKGFIWVFSLRGIQSTMVVKTHSRQGRHGGRSRKLSDHIATTLRKQKVKSKKWEQSS